MVGGGGGDRGGVGWLGMDESETWEITRFFPWVGVGPGRRGGMMCGL